METLYAVSIITLSILLGIIMIIKISALYTHMSRRYNVQHNFFMNYLILTAATFSIWFPVLLSPNDENERKKFKNINRLTLVFYIVVVMLGIVILIRLGTID